MGESGVDQSYCASVSPGAASPSTILETAFESSYFSRALSSKRGAIFMAARRSVVDVAGRRLDGRHPQEEVAVAAKSLDEPVEIEPVTGSEDQVLDAVPDVVAVVDPRAG